MTEEMHLFHKLQVYGNSDIYPYHMPGHKRRQLGSIPGEYLKTDITEIDGFDNLHQAEGILAEAQKRANSLYRADETFYLVNGSTGGILSAVSAALPEKGHLLMTRGCHKSVYHAAYLRGLKVTYLYPDRVDGFEFSEAVTAEQVENALNEGSDIDAVLIVSPTYEGRIADIRAIAEVVHKRGIPLIVDEAHGTHLGFADGFAPGSCTQGADLVIHSVHKTLPAMTQTALLHVNGDLIDRERLKRFLRIYQSSSPSYVLMASICDAMDIVEKDGHRLFCEFRKEYFSMVRQLESCSFLRFIPLSDVESCKQDIGKLVIATNNPEVSGQWLYNALRERYHIQCEMAAGGYCLAMFTIADSGEAYARMLHALTELDAELAFLYRKQPSVINSSTDSISENISKPDIRYRLEQAWNLPNKMTKLSESVGRPVGDFVNLYPPGTPILVPGEVLSRELYEKLLEMLDKNLNIQGIKNEGGEYLIRTISDENRTGVEV